MPESAVLYATDANYWPHLYVSLSSLLKNNPDRHWRVFIACDRVDDTFAARVPLLGKNVDVRFVTSERLRFDAPPVKHLTEATYYRLMAARIVSPDVTRLLYLDADTVTVGPLNDLLAVDLAGHLFAATENTWKQQQLRERFGVPAYFNAGVMLLNMEIWRNLDVEQQACDYLEANRGRTVCDQDILNALFSNDWIPFPARFNDQTDCLSPNPTIVHYAGGKKPWKPLDPASLYWRYRQKTPYAVSLLRIRAVASQLQDRASALRPSRLRRLYRRWMAALRAQQA